MKPYLYNIFSVYLLLTLISCGSPKPAGEINRPGKTAISAVDFLNSLGVNTAVSRRGESLNKTIEITKYLGIRWIRSGYEGGLPVDDLIKLHDKTGIRFSYGLLSGGTNIQRLLNGARRLAAAGALLSIEGPNEPNNWSVTYQGKKGGGNSTWMPVAKLQRDLYKVVKNDPVLKTYPVWSLTENGAETDNVGLQFLEIPEGATTLMPDGTKYADYANCHNYFMHPSHPGLYDNQTWNAADPTNLCKVDGLYGNYGSTWRTHFSGYSKDELSTLPRVTTETGAALKGVLTEDRQACLFMNLFLDQFTRGWSYTALYLLRDRSDESGNQQFGFYKPDYTPRTAAVYFHNLTSILADSGSIRHPGKLNYSIPGKPKTVHELLLQKHTGTFDLIVWNERVNGSDKVEVNLGKPYAVMNIYDPTKGTSKAQSFNNTSSLDLTLSDHPMIIEIL
jgi:hypothetical protein